MRRSEPGGAASSGKAADHDERWNLIERFAGELHEGTRLYRFEQCHKCGRIWSHVFECLSVQPRVWATQCLWCKPGE